MIFFITLLSLFLTFNVASRGDFSKYQLEPFIRGLHNSFLHQSLNEPLSKEKFRQFIFYIANFPLKALEIVNDLQNREFSYYFARLRTHCNFGCGKYLIPFVTLTRHVDIPHAFVLFDLILKHYLPRNFKKEFWNLGLCQNLTKVIISILKTIDYSDKRFEITTFGLKPETSITTKGYIDLLCLISRNFDPDDDMVRGFERAHFLLRSLSIEYEGNIPPQMNQKIRIYSLFFISHYYAHCIYWDFFKCLEIETANPQVLAFILKFDGYFVSDHLFSLLQEPSSLALEILDKYKDFSDVKEFLSKFGKDTHCRVLLPRVGEEMRETQNVKIYLRLARYCSQFKKEPIK
jgi:hypothetical protein